MGGTSKQTQTSQQQTTQNPWAPTIPGLTDLTNKVSGQIGNAGLSSRQTGALDAMQSNADAGNPYASRIGILANDMLGGGPDRTGYVTGAHDQFGANLAPTIAGDFLDPNKNPFFSNTTNAISSDVMNRVNGMFAGAGRDLSGANLNTLASEITKATAPIYAQTYANERGNQIDAMKSAYGAGGNTAGLLSNLDQTKFDTQREGIGVAGQALDANNYGPMQTMAIEAQRLGIPLEQYAKIAGILGPLGGMGGTSNSSGTATGTNTMSGAQQFATIAGGLNNTGKFLWG